MKRASNYHEHDPDALIAHGIAAAQAMPAKLAAIAHGDPCAALVSIAAAAGYLQRAHEIALEKLGSRGPQATSLLSEAHAAGRAWADAAALRAAQRNN